MIEIKKDMSYLSELDLLSVEKGIAELGIHSIRFSNNLTEEEKEENSKIAKILSREEWSKRCEKNRLKVGARIEGIVDLINENFTVYQYKNKNIHYSKDDWDLFFWSNCGDMSYVTLNPNSDRTNEEQIRDIDKVLTLIESVDIVGVKVDIQYKVIYKNEMVKNIASEVYSNVKDKFVNYNGFTGKIKEVGKSYSGATVYGFFKKGARTNYYQVANSWFLQQSFTE